MYPIGDRRAWLADIAAFLHENDVPQALFEREVFLSRLALAESAEFSDARKGASIGVTRRRIQQILRAISDQFPPLKPARIDLSAYRPAEAIILDCFNNTTERLTIHAIQDLCRNDNLPFVQDLERLGAVLDRAVEQGCLVRHKNGNHMEYRSTGQTFRYREAQTLERIWMRSAKAAAIVANSQPRQINCIHAKINKDGFDYLIDWISRAKSESTGTSGFFREFIRRDEQSRARIELGNKHPHNFGLVVAGAPASPNKLPTIGKLLDVIYSSYRTDLFFQRLHGYFDSAASLDFKRSGVKSLAAELKKELQYASSLGTSPRIKFSLFISYAAINPHDSSESAFVNP
ncbi:MAG: hypothetical protein QM775_09590 [Pirellulales bacterium]